MIESIVGKEFPAKVIPLIDNAHHSIRIIVFDWRWYPNDPANPVQLFNQAIIRAVRRGVRVSIVTNVPEVANILKQNGCIVNKPISDKLIHAKMMLIDSDILVIGSHNYTQNAFTMNFEVSVIIPDLSHSLLAMGRLNSFFDSMLQL